MPEGEEAKFIELVLLSQRSGPWPAELWLAVMTQPIAESTDASCLNVRPMSLHTARRLVGSETMAGSFPADAQVFVPAGGGFLVCRTAFRNSRQRLARLMELLLDAHNRLDLLINQ
ncbi:hypothetical protein NX059_006903 [Plenodomus lindquistii]|nr:hypothetical protein NX059_006903 [Plenodomus lindquistii]